MKWENYSICSCTNGGCYYRVLNDFEGTETLLHAIRNGSNLRAEALTYHEEDGTWSLQWGNAAGTLPESIHEAARLLKSSEADWNELHVEMLNELTCNDDSLVASLTKMLVVLWPQMLYDYDNYEVQQIAVYSACTRDGIEPDAEEAVLRFEGECLEVTKIRTYANGQSSYSVRNLITDETETVKCMDLYNALTRAVWNVSDHLVRMDDLKFTDASVCVDDTDHAVYALHA